MRKRYRFRELAEFLCHQFCIVRSARPACRHQRFGKLRCRLASRLTWLRSTGSRRRRSACRCNRVCSITNKHRRTSASPISTVGHPTIITPPWAVESPILAAGSPAMKTVADPFTITSGGLTHVAMSETRAAGRPPISTVGQQGAMIGPPTCGTGPLKAGQMCMSVNRAAGRSPAMSICSNGQDRSQQ